MSLSTDRRFVAGFLDRAGLQINGHRPFDIQVHNPEFFTQLMVGGSMALGESYMDGWWDCDALDQFFERIMAAQLDRKACATKSVWWSAVRSIRANVHDRNRAFEIGTRHYEIGNDLFRVMLDRRMNYSCAFWHNTQNLNAAQEAKLDLTCCKLRLESGMQVLDIGCGWGGFAIYAAEKFGVEVTGITVSVEQVQLAQTCCRDLPVCIVLQNYRDIKGSFDRIVSIGMFEHVGAPSYRTYMQTVHRCLKPDGLFLLHTIGSNRSLHETDPWIAKYTFPNSRLPSAQQIADASEGLFVLEDWHSFGQHYDSTPMAWYRNIKDNWRMLQDAYDERFYRMWTYYLLTCAGTFRARRNQLW